MDLKSRISTPLEAGTSILDVHRLPSYIVPALEYTSRRLAEKGLHITLVVARRDYQLPGYSAANNTNITCRESTVTNLPSPPCSPASPDLVPCRAGLNNAIRTLVVRSGTQKEKETRNMERTDFGRARRSKTGPLSRKTSLASLFDGSLGSPRLRWTSPTNNASHAPRTPKTPATPASYVTTASSASSVAGGSLGAQGPEVRLIHTTSLAPRAYKLVATTLARASRRFNLNVTLAAHEPATYNVPSVVLHSSILQNEVLHSSEGMTLLSLDHLYTFKTALGHYAATRAEPSRHFQLEDAVDELRRYVVSSTAGRRRLLKSTLIQAYDWLGPVDDAALAEVTMMYSRAYGTATDVGVEDDLVQVTSKGSATEAPPCAPPEDQADDASISGTSSTSSPSQGLLSRMSAQTWVAEDYAPRVDEDMVDESDTPLAKSPVDIPMGGMIDTVAEPAMMITDADDSGERTPVPSRETSHTSTTPTAPAHAPQTIPQPLPRLPPLAPHQIPSPKPAVRPSAPSLKLQTNLPPIHKSTPKRKKTPVPSKRQQSRRTTKARPALPTSLLLAPVCAPASPAAGMDIRIELSISDDGDDDDNHDDNSSNNNNNDDNDGQSDTESLQTDFEDAELTARSPAKTPGGSIWLGIDDILSSAGGFHGRRRTSRRSSRRRTTRSSDLFLQTPAGEKAGPMTPNGYEDISPVTRGEWGFLMVGETFRTRTAGVSCV